MINERYIHIYENFKRKLEKVTEAISKAQHLQNKYDTSSELYQDALNAEIELLQEKRILLSTMKESLVSEV